MLGCTNLDAINRNPLANEEDYSCLYNLRASGGPVYYFHDYVNLVDKSFTLSFDTKGKSWVFFHDYIPDFYFHTRNQLWTLKQQRIFKHNAGPKGTYYPGDGTKPFFIDVIFKSDSDLLLETVDWITEVINSDEAENEWETITHISIWNSQQHSGRIELSSLFNDMQYKSMRRTKGSWSFNDFRNVLKERGTAFLMDIFNNYALVNNSVADKGWYDQDLLQDKYFVIRFEHDNVSNNKVILHQTNVQVLKSNR